MNKSLKRQELRHHHIAATMRTQRVHPHVIYQDAAANKTRQITLPTTKMSYDSLGDAAKSFGHSKKGREAWAQGLQYGLNTVDEPDLSYLFMFGAYTAFEIKAAQCIPHMEVPVLRKPDVRGKLKDMYPFEGVSASGGEGPLKERINAACRDGKTHIPMITEQAIYAFVVWELLRDKALHEEVDSPLTISACDVYVRRSRFIHWRGCQFWTSWPASVRGREDLDSRLTGARSRSCHST